MENCYRDPTSLPSPTDLESYLSSLMNEPLPDISIQQTQHHEIMLIGPTGHNTEQGSGSGLPREIGDIRRSELGAGSGSGSGSGPLWGNEAPVGNIRIWEQGSGSGLAQANMVETEATAAVPGRPGQKRNGEISSAERSKNSRAKKNKEDYDMKVEMQRLQEENKELHRDLIASKRKLKVLRKKIRQSKERLARSKEDLDGQKIQINILSKSLENISYLQEETTRLKALMQQGNAGTNAKKWVKIPLGDRILKIKGNVLFLKMV